MITKSDLERLYVDQKQSMQAIADRLECSLSQVAYWMNRYGIKRRSIADAVYLQNNPEGDPFSFVRPKNQHQAILFGLGLGLYWGEGNKANRNSIRLGNTDPKLVLIFLRFLEQTFQVRRTDFRFSLQIFSDMPAARELDFWTKYLTLRKSQFYRTTITPYRSIGTYRQKTKHGVLTVYYHNVKMRDQLVALLECEPDKYLKPL